MILVFTFFSLIIYSEKTPCSQENQCRRRQEQPVGECRKMVVRRMSRRSEDKTHANPNGMFVDLHSLGSASTRTRSSPLSTPRCTTADRCTRPSCGSGPRWVVLICPHFSDEKSAGSGVQTNLLLSFFFFFYVRRTYRKIRTCYKAEWAAVTSNKGCWETVGFYLPVLRLLGKRRWWNGQAYSSYSYSLLF